VVSTGCKVSLVVRVVAVVQAANAIMVNGHTGIAGVGRLLVWRIKSHQLRLADVDETA
jgi:hypothetical protein